MRAQRSRRRSRRSSRLRDPVSIVRSRKCEIADETTYAREMLRPSLALLAISSLFLLAPSFALAGSCPSCTTSADCMDPSGGPAFCVLHDDDVGCGMTRQICCPGQGCSTMSGRPSCEGTTCTVVDGPPAPDAAMSSPDAAMAAGEDAGSTPSDTGTVAIDAGSPGRDADPTPMATSSCGCRASATDPMSITLVALAGLALVLRARRAPAGSRARA